MKPITWFFFLTALVFAGDYLGGSLLHQLVRKSQFRYSQMYAGNAAADIVLIGNSRGLAFYQPHIETITGKTTHNLSYNGLPANLANVLILDYFERYPKTKTLVIDITLCDRPNKELVAGFTTYAPQSHNIDSLIFNNARDIWWGAQISSLFSCNNEVFQRAMYYRNKSDKDWIVDRQIAPALAATVPLDTFPIHVQPDIVAHLRAAIYTARSYGAQVHLVVGPYYPGMVKDWSNLKALIAEVERQIAMNVHDYSQALKDPSDFGDLMHPNKQGAIHYMELLKEDGIFQ